MAKKNNWLIPSLIGLGVLSVALSLVVSSLTEKQKVATRPLARVDLSLGKAFILRKNMTQKEALTRSASLYPLDSVETGPDGDATMTFDSAYRIRIQENSLVTLDEEYDRQVILIKRGDVQVEAYGRDGSVMISRDGVRWTATDYETNYRKQANSPNLPDMAPSTEGYTGKKAGGEGLTSEFIQETLRTHRNSFFKCYTQLLQRTPGVSGQASVGFTIERTGKVSNPTVTSSTISDVPFKKCLTEAIRRVEFKSFAGDPISTVFPLKFE
ncbi:energy transducer TonB [Bdellovibrio sp. ZAP7]|uniref:AgmX/PglI C-terminal domain-containing protein n=1 Tax=Bdellovibrio sp. ZAP7 TaxID=2231053 RepID=UPI00115A94EF|nr:AgmX/PglI C-terminal domain-containing protein [Bdellovibrio sp. ZAP7]QDK46401.1 energy transducer TonB [Bdellovibrio sp. ZAP7]